MPLFKCKMCGGTIEFVHGSTVGVCDSCGTRQTLPKTDDGVITNLFNRANNLRLKCEFDKAEQIYEKIVEQDDSEAEAHWGIVLCKYGIEYVEDPKTGKRLPTCHRTLFDAVTADPDYQAAIDYADAGSQAIYESEARAIDRIQKDILTIVKNENPFDVFICYKETDENGRRTMDSAIANDIYYQLTNEGFKVFYAAITLEDKLGQEYEPYIFAALNSAKVMLAVGTKPEYFNAVWVKNEWSRFMHLMKTDRTKLLIPCYRDMDAYDLPEEFAHLQAQDMGKIGFINDITRGIKKILDINDSQRKLLADKESVVVNNVATGTAPLLRRAFMFLEDGCWQEADEYCEKVLDQEPENAQAYLGKLMATVHAKKQEDLKNCQKPFDGIIHFQRLLRYADPALIDTLKGYITRIYERNENFRLISTYETATKAMKDANTANEWKAAAETFSSIRGYKDAERKMEICQMEAKRKAKRDKCKRVIRISILVLIIAAAIVAITVATIIGVKDYLIGVKDNTVASLFSHESNADGTLIITGYRGTDSTIIIPKQITGKIVTSIGDSAFSGLSNLTSITIPESVTSIGDNAFSGCSNLTSITLPEGLTSIGQSAFSLCSSLTTITIPEGVSGIGDFAFSNCNNLTIKCKAKSGSTEWGNRWNSSNRPVVWGYTGS